MYDIGAGLLLVSVIADQSLLVDGRVGVHDTVADVKRRQYQEGAEQDCHGAHSVLDVEVPERLGLEPLPKRNNGAYAFFPLQRQTGLVSEKQSKDQINISYR